MKKEQRVFSFSNFPDKVAIELSRLIDKGYHIDSMASVQDGSNIHMMNVIVIASIEVEAGE